MSAASHLALVKDDDIKIAPIIFPGPLVRVGRWRGNVELLLDDKGQATMASHCRLPSLYNNNIIIQFTIIVSTAPARQYE